MQVQNTSNPVFLTYLQAAYSAIQLRLTALQSNPELTQIISEVNLVCTFIDLFSLSYNGAKAIRFVKHKYVRQNATQEEHQRFNRKMGIAVAGILGFSFLSVISVNHLIQKRFFSTDLMSLAKSSTGTLEGVSFQWNSSVVHKARQFILLNQLIATSTVAYFSKSKLSLMTAVAQLGNLTLMSGQKWIEYTRIVQDPLAEFAKDGAKYQFSPTGLQQIEIKSHFLFQTKDINTSAKLSEKLNEIVSGMTNLFKNSVWSRMIITKKTKHSTHTYMQYFVTVITHQIQSCAGIEITGKDSLAGEARFLLKYPSI